ncbi:MAG: hypothetical protein ACK56I_12675, partial [bacterium]
SEVASTNASTIALYILYRIKLSRNIFHMIATQMNHIFNFIHLKIHRRGTNDEKSTEDSLKPERKLL